MTSQYCGTLNVNGTSQSWWILVPFPFNSTRNKGVKEQLTLVPGNWTMVKFSCYCRGTQLKVTLLKQQMYGSSLRANIFPWQQSQQKLPRNFHSSRSMRKHRWWIAAMNQGHSRLLVFTKDRYFVFEHKATSLHCLCISPEEQLARIHQKKQTKSGTLLKKNWEMES